MSWHLFVQCDYFCSIAKHTKKNTEKGVVSNEHDRSDMAMKHTKRKTHGGGKGKVYIYITHCLLRSIESLKTCKTGFAADSIVCC